MTSLACINCMYCLLPPPCNFATVTKMSCKKALLHYGGEREHLLQGCCCGWLILLQENGLPHLKSMGEGDKHDRTHYTRRRRRREQAFLKQVFPGKNTATLDFFFRETGRANVEEAASLPRHLFRGQIPKFHSRERGGIETEENLPAIASCGIPCSSDASDFTGRVLTASFVRDYSAEKVMPLFQTVCETPPAKMPYFSSWLYSHSVLSKNTKRGVVCEDLLHAEGDFVIYPMI